MNGESYRFKDSVRRRGKTAVHSQPITGRTAQAKDAKEERENTP